MFSNGWPIARCVFEHHRVDDRAVIGESHQTRGSVGGRPRKTAPSWYHCLQCLSIVASTWAKIGTFSSPGIRTMSLRISPRNVSPIHHKRILRSIHDGTCEQFAAVDCLIVSEIRHQPARLCSDQTDPKGHYFLHLHISSDFCLTKLHIQT